MIIPDGQFRIVFTALDYAATVKFYREDLELLLDHDWDYGPDDKGTVLQAGTGLIEFFSPVAGAEPVQPQGIGMLIQVQDADQIYQRLLDRGLTILQEPTSYPWGHRVMRIADPNGIVVSFFSLIQDA